MTAQDAQIERDCECWDFSPCQDCRTYAQQVRWYRQIKRLLAHDPWADPVPPPPDVEKLHGLSAHLRALLTTKIPPTEPLADAIRYKNMTPETALEVLASENPHVAPWVTRWARRMVALPDWRTRIGLEKGEDHDKAV